MDYVGVDALIVTILIALVHICTCVSIAQTRYTPLACNLLTPTAHRRTLWDRGVFFLLTAYACPY